MSQSSDIKAEILNLLEKGKSLDKSQIYTIVMQKMNVPRPTVRRIARDVRNELQSKVNVLSSQSPAHNKWTDIQRMPYQ